MSKTTEAEHSALPLIIRDATRLDRSQFLCLGFIVVTGGAVAHDVEAKEIGGTS
jgi:hypothetical protein